MTVYCIGIKGVGMTALAQIYNGLGYTVCGSDVPETFLTDDVLSQEHIKVYESFSADHITDEIDMVIVSAAFMYTDNPELQAARAKELPVYTYSEALGNLSRQFASVAVIGTHGKSTTTALLGVAMEQLGADPFVVVGSSVPQLGGNARVGSQDSTYLVAEVDEYRYHLLDFSAKYTILTTLDYDHPDVFVNETMYRNAFHQYLDKLSSEAVVVANQDNPGVMRLLKKRPESDTFEIITYGASEEADVRIQEETYIFIEGECISPLTVSLPGAHNRSNATGAFALLWHLGYEPDAIKSAIATFRGLARRQELKGRMNTGATLIDDYAHHPAEIRAVYNALREEYPEHRLWIIFQPHTYTRTEALKDDIANALAEFDVVWLRPVYGSAREKEGDVSAEDIRELILAKFQDHDASTIKSIVSETDMEATLRTETDHNDILVTMGAGDIHKLGEHLIEPN